MEINEAYKVSLENAWRFFQLHAQQRMAVFNFYLIITGLVAAGLSACVIQMEKLSIVAGVLGLFLSFVSFIFWKLDQRVSLMIKASEKSIINIETKLALPIESIFIEDSGNLSNSYLYLLSPWTYGRCFRLSFFVVGVIGIGFACNNLIPYSTLHETITSWVQSKG